MKLFENPEIEIIRFAMEDIITTSGVDATNPGDDTDIGDNETPIF